MSFKVGDRVRIVGTNSLLGDVTGISASDTTIYVRPLGDYMSYGYCRASLEHVELVQPASPPSPVRTKTVKEIVPGRYGRIEIADAESRVYADVPRVFVECIGWFNASELREAARIFIELADALEA